MLNQTNFNTVSGDISIMRGSCNSIDKEFERKVQQTKNLLRQTTLSLQKIADSKQDFLFSSNDINSTTSPKRKISILKHNGIQIFDSELKISKELIEPLNSQTSNSQLLISGSNLQIAAPGGGEGGGSYIQQEESASKIYSAQNNSLINDALSSKCSIQMDFKPKQRQKSSESVGNDALCIDAENFLEKKIHQWLDEQGVRMVNPNKKHQDYFEQKKSQILIMHKKKNFVSNALIASCQISGGEVIYTQTQNSEKFISYSYNVSPQKMHDEGDQYQYTKNGKNTINGSNILASSLFSTSITDSPLMQRRKIMLKNAQQDSDLSTNISEKKPSNLSVNSVTGNRQIKSSLCHLSQYKRSNLTSSNNEIISSELSTDCK